MDTFLRLDIFRIFSPPGALLVVKNAKNSHENADVYATRLAQSSSVRAGSSKNRVSGSSFLQKMPKSTVKCHRPRAAQKVHFVIKFEYKMDTFLSLDIFKIFSLRESFTTNQRNQCQCNQCQSNQCQCNQCQRNQCRGNQCACQ